MIRERVCRIVATRDEAPVAAAVRFDTSTDKLGGMLLHDAPLPRLEHHWSQMLPARAVLRKQHWPGVRIRVDDRDDAPPADPDRAAGPQHRDGFGDSADDRFLVPTPRPARGWPSADGRGGRIRTCKSSRTEDFKSSVFASFTTPPSSETLDLLVDLADAALLVLLLGERLGFSLLLGLFLRLHALVRAADPLVDVLDPGRQVPLVGLEDQGLMHHPEAPGMTQDRGLGRLREEPGPLTRRRRAELDGPGELVALEIGRLRGSHSLDQLSHGGSPRNPLGVGDLEAASGFEPLSRGFADLRLSHLATPPRWREPVDRKRAGAGNGIRTRDPDLGKVVLYH